MGGGGENICGRNEYSFLGEQIFRGTNIQGNKYSLIVLMQRATIGSIYSIQLQSKKKILISCEIKPVELAAAASKISFQISLNDTPLQYL